MLLCCLTACSTTRFDVQGTINDKSEAGQLTFETIFRGAVEDTVQKLQLRERAEGRYLVVQLGVDVDSAQDLGPEKYAYLQDWLGSDLYETGMFEIISTKFVNTAFNELGISDFEKLQLPSYRRQFLDLLEGLGAAPDYLIFPRITSITSKNSNRLRSTRQVTYRISLTLVDARSGVTACVGKHSVTKDYVKGWF